MRRLLVTGGGTGGHLYPGVAVAEAARSRFPGLEVRFVGGPRLEARVLPDAGWGFSTVAARPLPRRVGLSAGAALAVNLWGATQSLRLLRRWRPDVILATGGYVAGPVGLAAALLGIPLVLQEQNAVPGLTNRLLGRWARAISVPEGAAPVFRPARTVVTGVPVRAGALRGDRATALAAFGLEAHRPTILVLGGSQGALSLNRVVAEAATLLMYEPWQILHQTGPEHVDWVRREIGHREHIGPPVIRHVAIAFIEPVGDAYAAADLVLCRAGASTLAEVTAWGLPAILVPYPHALAGEQDANARLMAAAGAAEVIADADLTAMALADRLRALLTDADSLRRMRDASRARGRPDAADRVVDLLAAVAPAGAPATAGRARAGAEP